MYDVVGLLDIPNPSSTPMLAFCFDINARLPEAQPQTSGSLKYSPAEYLLHTSKQTNIATNLMQHHRIKNLVSDSGPPYLPPDPELSTTIFHHAIIQTPLRDLESIAEMTRL